MKILTLNKLSVVYGALSTGKIHFLNPDSINEIYESEVFNPHDSVYSYVTAIKYFDGSVTLVQEDIETVLRLWEEVVK